MRKLPNMLHFDEQSLKDLAGLCKIACDEQELSRLMKNLEAILEYVDQLNALNTEGVPPCRQIADDLTLELGDDAVSDLLEAADYLRNIPSKVGGMIKIPAIFKS